MIITTDYNIITSLVGLYSNDFADSTFVANNLTSTKIELHLYELANDKNKFFDAQCLVDNNTDIAYRDWHSYCAYKICGKLFGAFTNSGLSLSSSSITNNQNIQERTIRNSLGQEIKTVFRSGTNTGSATSTKTGYTIGQEYYDNKAKEIINRYKNGIYL